MPSLPLYRLLVLLFLATATSHAAAAQVADDFSDGDFASNPEWRGSSDRWQIVPFEGSSMLNSNGVEKADTLHLATVSSVAYGSWAFRFIHQDVNLSNFNGARIFLVADGPDLTADVRGYFLQLGTNNTDAIRLYRLDPGNRRTEIGRSNDALLDGTSNDLRIRVERSSRSAWVVYSGDREIISAVDSTYATSAYFGVWLKHSATAADAYFFDDIEIVEGEAPQRDAPHLEARVVSSTRIILRYSRSVARADACDASNYDVIGLTVIDVECPELTDYVDQVQLRTASPIPAGNYVLLIGRISDETGGSFDSIDAEMDASTEDVMPFVITRAEHSNRSPRQVRVELSRQFDLSTIDETSIRFVPDLATGELEANPAGTEIAVLLEGIPAPGAYELRATGLRDLAGDVLESHTDLNIHSAPSADAVVINEIHFNPPDQDLEFLELINLSPETIDAADLDYADDRTVETPVATVETPIEAGAYFVLARDTAAFAAAFPGIPASQPDSWHTLNNSGDAVVLRHRGATLDSVAFTASWISGNSSLERIDPNAPAIRPNFGSSGDPNGATPGRLNSLYSTQRAATRAIGAEEIELGVIRISFNAALDSHSISRTTFAFDEVPAADWLMDGDDAVIVLTGDTRPRTVTFTGLRDLFDDDVGDAVLDVAVLPREHELIINEIMYDPRAIADDGLPDQPEYVELINVSDRLLAVSQLHLADAPDENGNPRSIHAGFPLSTSMPGGFVVIVAEPDASPDYTSEGKLASAFGSTAALARDEVTLLPVRRSTLSLPQSGRLIRILHVDGETITETRYRPDWHHPALDYTTGVALERMDPSPIADDDINWTTSTSASGGTPGAANSVYLTAATTPGRPGITVDPSIFSPDLDGVDDFAQINFRLEAPSASVRVRIFDSRGRQVRHLEPAAFVGREGSIPWDGHDDEGRRLRIGIYIVFLDAIDAEHGTTESYKTPVVLARPLG